MAIIPEYPDFEQILVLGRGLEPDGTVQYDCGASGDSYDRGAAAGSYGALHASVLRRAIFSGGYSFVLDVQGESQPGSEALGMLQTAVAHGLPEEVEAVLDESSKTTYGNFINTAKYFSPGETVGLVTHQDHLKRAIRFGAKVLPEVIFYPIVADNPARIIRRGRARAVETASSLVYAAAMAPIRRGDIEHIARRDQQFQNLVLSGIRGVSRLRGQTNQPTNPA